MNTEEAEAATGHTPDTAEARAEAQRRWAYDYAREGDRLTVQQAFVDGAQWAAALVGSRHPEPTEARDPYAECVCGHGRHTHVRYTGACGLCKCPAVRTAPVSEERTET